MAAVPEVLNVSIAARQYVAGGWALVPIDNGTKGPTAAGWNRRENCVTSTAQCGRIRANVGLAHAYSGTCVVDLDDIDLARAWLAGKGVSLADLWDAPDAVRISSGRPNRGKLLFKLPAGVTPPTTHMLPEHGLELRCAASNGLTVQDVLPPSIHPDTGRPYMWDYDEQWTDWSTPPELPPELLAVWRAVRKAPAEKVERAERAGSAERDDKAPLGLGKSEIRKLLAQLSPDCDYKEWVGTGFAVHHEMRGAALGLELWDEWSSEGVDYPGPDALERKWSGFGQGYDGPVRTIRSLMQHVGITDVDDFDDLTEPGARAADPADDFEVLDDAPGEPAQRKKFKVLSATEFSARPPMTWIIKGILPRATLGVLFGESGAGKSFIAWDMLAAVARGVDWRGRKVKQGRVVMIVAEGQSGAVGRLVAYAQHHGIDLSDVPIGIIEDVPNLLSADDKVIAKRIEEYGGADVVLIDTLAQSVAGANENSGDDMGKAISHCKRLNAATGAMVLLVHHAGKDATRGARGWSGIKAAADIEIEVTRSGKQRAIQVTKSKDGEDGETMGFKLNTVVIGEDEDGEDVTSCVIEHTNDPVVKTSPKDKLTDKHHAVLEVLQQAADLAGPVHYVDLKRLSIDRLVPGNTDNRARDVEKAIERLEALGYIGKDSASNYAILQK